MALFSECFLGQTIPVLLKKKDQTAKIPMIKEKRIKEKK
jgi:hypothetical protein